jgi:hypothetical protein
MAALPLVARLLLFQPMNGILTFQFLTIQSTHQRLPASANRLLWLCASGSNQTSWMPWCEHFSRRRSNGSADVMRLAVAVAVVGMHDAKRRLWQRKQSNVPGADAWYSECLHQ